MGYRDLSVFVNQSDGSRTKVLTNGVDKKQQGVVPLQQEALNLLEKMKSLRDIAEDELTDELVKYEGYVTQIRRVKEKLEHDLSTVERDNQAYREKAIKDT